MEQKMEEKLVKSTDYLLIIIKYVNWDFHPWEGKKGDLKKRNASYGIV